MRFIESRKHEQNLLFVQGCLQTRSLRNQQGRSLRYLQDCQPRWHRFCRLQARLPRWRHQRHCFRCHHGRRYRRPRFLSGEQIWVIRYIQIAATAPTAAVELSWKLYLLASITTYFKLSTSNINWNCFNYFCSNPIFLPILNYLRTSKFEFIWFIKLLLVS